MSNDGVFLIAKVHDPLEDEFFQASEVEEERDLAAGEEELLSRSFDVVFEPAGVEVRKEGLVEEAE